MTQPWLRLENESTKGYNAFCKYRDMSPDVRSYDKVREALGKKAGYIRQLEYWASSYNWVQRATQYDDYCDAQSLAAVELARKEMAERKAKVGMLLQSKGIEKMQNVTEVNITTGEAIRSIEIGTRIERTARGEPSEIQKSEHSGTVQVDVTDISDEDLLRIAQGGGGG